MTYPEQELRDQIAAEGGALTMTWGELGERFHLDERSEGDRGAITALLESSGLRVGEDVAIGQQKAVRLELAQPPEGSLAPRRPEEMPRPVYADRETNTLAIVAFVLALFGGAFIAAALGFRSLGQIRRADGGEKGDGLAKAAVVLGLIQTAFWTVIVVFAFLGFAGVF